MIAYLAQSPLIERLGWLLVHSLWQFTAVALVAAALLTLLRRASAEARYWTGLVALASMTALPVVTWFCIPELVPPPAVAATPLSTIVVPLAVPMSPEQPMPRADEPRDREPPVGRASGLPVILFQPASASGDPWWPRIEQAITPWLPAVVLAWCVGVLLFTLRPLTSWLAIRRLRASGQPASPALETALAGLAQRLGLRRAVRVMQSTLIRAPVVVGWLRPLILLPVCIVCELPAGQLDAILAHELAHIRRHDFLINLLQTLLETVCFYHPAVWWLSHQIRLERENCCDDLAVAALGNRGQYGRALLAIEELRGDQPTLALGARGGSLMARVRRIVLPEAAAPSQLGGSLAAMGLLGVALAAGLWAMAHAADPPPADIAPPPATTWPQWGGSSLRNNVSQATNVPIAWDLSKKQNLRWTAKLGTFSFTSPVVSQGKVLIGTNNLAERNPKYPAKTDMSCLQCFDEQTGEFLWQYASPKLPTGRVHDWPEIGLCATPATLGERVWVVTNRAEVLCLDLLGFRDGQNDGPITDEAETGPESADLIWRLDMMKQLGVSQTYQSCSSVTLVGDLVLLNTGNGVDASHITIPVPDAPSFLAVNRHTGHVVWSDASPGKNILGGECPSTSPAVGVLGGVLQAIFAAADGWLYAFDVRAMEQGRTMLLWKFDCNPKTSIQELGGRGTRNSLIAVPVIADGRVYIPVGQNPEHGEGPGHLWCIDPTKRGDISPELVFNKANPDQPIPHKCIQACDESEGDFTRPNPNSGAIWHYDSFDANGNGNIDFEETMHRSCGSVVVSGGLVAVADFSGLLHCLDATTGKLLWTHDLLAAVWSTPLVAEGRMYVGDEDGDIAIFRLARTKELIAEPNVENSVYGTPAAVNGALLVNTKSQLVAIQTQPPAAAPPPAAQPAAYDPKQPWIVRGRVVDGDGKPVAGAEIIAHCGNGTLFPTGRATTGDDGRYEFKFGPGITVFGEDHPQTQAATISVRKAALFEKNLHRHGGCVASLKPLSEESLKYFRITKDQVFLPGQPLTLDFVMPPAARVRGTLVDERDRPLADHSVSLTGRELPPSCSVLRQVRTDERGRFEIGEIPTSFAFQFEIRRPDPQPPWDDSWASPPLFFERTERDDLAAKDSREQVALEKFRLKIVGPGVHGKKAVADAQKQPLAWQGKSQLEQAPGALGKRTAQELTLVLQNAADPPAAPAPAKKEDPVGFKIPENSLKLARAVAAAELANRRPPADRRPAGLGDVSTPEAIERAAAAALADLSIAAKREEAHARLKYLGEDALAALVRGLKSDDLQTAIRCVGLLEYRGAKGVGPLIEQLRTNPDPRIREAAAGALSQTYQPEAVLPLIAALDDAHGGVRAAACGALKYFRDPRAIEPLRKHTADSGYGHVAAESIKHIESPQGYAWWPPELLDLKQLANDASTLRGERFGKDEIARLEASMTSADWTVAGACVLALGSLDSRTSVAAIQASKAPYKHHVLAQFGTPEAIDYLLGQLQTGDKYSREATLSGLADGGGRWAAPLFVAMLDEPSLAVPAHRDILPIEWPAAHGAHSAFFSYLFRFGLPGNMLNLHAGQKNDVQAEMARLRTWWAAHGQDFVNGKTVPNPELTTVMYNDP